MRLLLPVAGLTLALGGLLAAVYCGRVSCAQTLYFKLKYGTLANDPVEKKEKLAELSYSLYPHNYYVSMLLAEAYWNVCCPANGDLVRERVDAARRWCERGISRNPFGRELIWIQARLAGLTSPEAALLIWEPYVDGVFWDAWNIATLIGLMADAGRVEDAQKLLPCLRGKPAYTAASRAIEEARVRQRYRHP